MNVKIEKQLQFSTEYNKISREIAAKSEPNNVMSEEFKNTHDCQDNHQYDNDINTLSNKNNNISNDDDNDDGNENDEPTHHIMDLIDRELLEPLSCSVCGNEHFKFVCGCTECNQHQNIVNKYKWCSQSCINYHFNHTSNFYFTDTPINVSVGDRKITLRKPKSPIKLSKKKTSPGTQKSSTKKIVVEKLSKLKKESEKLPPKIAKTVLTKRIKDISDRMLIQGGIDNVSDKKQMKEENIDFKIGDEAFQIHLKKNDTNRLFLSLSKKKGTKLHDFKGNINRDLIYDSGTKSYVITFNFPNQENKGLIFFYTLYPQLNYLYYYIFTFNTK